MKIKSFLAIGLVVLTLSSCEKLKELTSVEVKTEVGATLSATPEEVSILEVPVQSVNFYKSAKVADGYLYYFKGEVDIDLSSNDDIGKYIDGITSFNINDGGITLNGMQTGDTVYTYTISVSESGVTSKSASLANNYLGSYAGGLGMLGLSDAVLVPGVPASPVGGIGAYVGLGPSAISNISANSSSGLDCSVKFAEAVTDLNGMGLTVNEENVSPTLTLDVSKVKDFVSEWKDSGFSTVTFTVEGTANFDVTNTLKSKLNLPSSVKYSPL